MTLLASTLIVGSMTGCGSTKLTKSSITIELGNEDAIKVSDFMDLSKDELKSAKLNTKDVNFFKEGNYKATISYKDKDYDIKVKVKDTVAPKITVSDNIVVQTNNPLHMSDIITEVTELSGNIDASLKISLSLKVQIIQKVYLQQRILKVAVHQLLLLVDVI